MGREIRKVPKDWEHPRAANGRYESLSYGCPGSTRDWDEQLAKHQEWTDEDVREEIGPRPKRESHMLLDVPEEACTHYQMYQTTSEGTPISPVMETPEEVARWLTDNLASFHGSETLPYEQWLDICHGGFRPDMVCDVPVEGPKAKGYSPKYDNVIDEALRITKDLMS